MDRDMTPDQRNALLSQIAEGMNVVDVDGDSVGSVEFVHMADENERLADTGVRDDNEGFVEEIAEVFAGDDEAEVTERMLRFGYVRIDASGIFTGRKYVEPHDIAAVEGDTVRLAVDKDAIGQPA